jgi:DNA-directed RNA polymerase subunit D
VKIDIVDRIKNENVDMARFILDGVGVEVANAFRRIILTEVPTMAIDEIVFLENNGVLYDEIIAHRLGLIPLTTDLKNYNLPEECSCGGQGCTLCQAEFSLEIGAQDTEQYVYSGSLIATDPKVHPVSDKILLVKLAKNSSIVFEAYARLGTGQEHAKFQPVCSIGYGNVANITIDNSKFTSEEQIDHVIKMDHTHIVEKVDGKLKLKEDYWKWADLSGALERYSPVGAITEDFYTDKFIFTIESSGALDIKEILLKAVEIFLEKIEEFDSQLKKVKIEEQVLHTIF